MSHPVSGNVQRHCLFVMPPSLSFLEKISDIALLLMPPSFGVLETISDIVLFVMPPSFGFLHAQTCELPPFWLLEFWVNVAFVASELPHQTPTWVALLLDVSMCMCVCHRRHSCFYSMRASRCKCKDPFMTMLRKFQSSCQVLVGHAEKS